MNDDDDNGGGTLVIPPTSPLAAQASAHQAMPTQVLPLMPGAELPPLGAVSSALAREAQAPNMAQPGRNLAPSWRPSQTLALPPGYDVPNHPASNHPASSHPASSPYPSNPRAASYPGPAYSASGYPSSGQQGAPTTQPQSFANRQPSAPTLPPFPSTTGPVQGAAVARNVRRPPNPFADVPTTVATRGKQGNASTLVVGGALVLVMALGIAGTVIVLQREHSEPPDPEPTTTAAVAATTPAATAEARTTAQAPSERPESTITGSASVSATVTASSTAVPIEPAASGPEAAALDALAKLQNAIDECTKNGTHVLPGTSPPIPDSFAKLKSGPYTPTARDWTSSFFQCAKLRLDQPMHFVIQWQLDDPSWRGTGIVWIDTDGDGLIDKAHSFYAQLKKRDEVQFAPTQPMDPTKRSPIPR